MSRGNSTPQPYTPANPPYTDKAQELSRATWEELYRIAERLISIDVPAALAVNGQDVCSVEPTQVWNRLFDAAKAYDWQAPLGQMNDATGEWTCPQEGLYNIQGLIQVPAFPNPGDRLYVATIRVTIRPADGSPDRVVIGTQSGNDAANMRMAVAVLRPLVRGDKMWMDLDITQENYTGSVTITSVLNIFRVSSIK